MVALEYFKSNLGTIEGNLTNDALEPKKHVDMYVTWFDWVESNSNGTAAHTEYLHLESMPKVVRGLLKRTFKEDKDIICVYEALINFLIIAIRKMHRAELAALLPTFFDPKQPFYVRHGFAKPKVVSANKRKFEAQPSFKQPQTWMIELEEGSCVDIMHPSRGWEIAVVEYVSESTNEIKVSLVDETTVFLKLDSDRVAKYGTRTGFADGDQEDEVVIDDTIDTALEPMVVDDENASKLSHLNMESSKQSKWRNALKTGSIVDVKAKNGNWQQGCICELRCVNLAETKCLDHARNAENSELSVIVADSPLKADSATPVGVIQTTFARVAMLGMSEAFDEWVDVFDTTLIQPLDSMSGGRRGDGIIRDELIYIVRNAEPGVNKDLNVALHSYLFSPFYLEMVSVFYRENGYSIAATHIVQSVPNGELSTRVPLEVLFQFIIVMGQVSPFVDNKEALQPNLSDVISCSIKRMTGMSALEIRETSTDLLEKAILSLEDIIHVVFGRTEQGGKVFDYYLAVRMAKLYLVCPFLNRRLWGLKRLIDLIHRCLHRQRFPGGLRAISQFSSSPPADSSDKSAAIAATDPVELLKRESVSYRTVKIAYAITPQELCNLICDEGFVIPLFIGETAHASLMQRASEVLRFLAVNGKLSTDILMQVWEAGFVLREPAALQVLVDVIQDLVLPPLCLLVETISLVGGDAVTASLVEIIAAIAQRLHLTTSSGEKNAALDVLGSSGPDIQDKETDHLFLRCLFLLWQWSSDGYRVDEVSASKALLKIEHLIGTYMATVATLQSVTSFDWNRHWERTSGVIQRAVEELCVNRSIVQAIKIIYAAIIAWPKMPTCSAVQGLRVADRLPFAQPTRACVAEFLNENLNILRVVTNTVVQSKLDLRLALNDINELSNSVPKGIKAPRDWEYFDVSVELQSVINDALVGSSRYGYTCTLEKCFDFINFFSRCSMGNNIKVVYEMVENIWNHVLRSAVTSKERDAVVSFISRLVQVRNVVPRHGNEQKDDTLGSVSHEPFVDGSATSTQRAHSSAASIMELCDVEKVFKQLLCDKKYIESAQLNAAGFNCIEKYFRWINAESGGIAELIGHDAKYIACKSLTQLEGWDVFLQIMLCCPDVSVAKLSIKFFTSLVNKFSIPLIENGEIGRHYSMLVDLSMSMLGRIKRDCDFQAGLVGDPNSDMMSTDEFPNVVSSDEDVQAEQVCMRILENILTCGDSSEHSEGKGGEDSEWIMVDDSKSEEARRQLVLQRILMLLGAVLDESATDTGRHNIQSHDARARSEPIEFKLTGAGKKKCIDISSLKMLMSDRLGDLLCRIQDAMTKPATLANVKIFHRGKDLAVSSANERLKTFKDLFFTSIETLMIIERPNIQTQAESSGDSIVPVTNAVSPNVNGRDQKGFVCSHTLSKELLPIMLLSRNETYFNILFSMLDYTSGELTVSLWTLILRLPTSHTFLLRWMHLGVQNVANNGILDLLGVPVPHPNLVKGPSDSSQKQTVNVPKLVYSLQIIENIMESNQLEENLAEVSTSQWIQLFVDRNGLNALATAFASVVDRLGNVLRSRYDCDETYNDSSGIILLQALSGLTKLIRFFLILFCSSSNAQELPEALIDFILKSKARWRILIGETTSSSASEPSGSSSRDYVQDLTVDDIFGDTKDSALKIDDAYLRSDSVFTPPNTMEEWGSKYLDDIRIAGVEKPLLLDMVSSLLSCLAYLNMLGRCFSAVTSTPCGARSAIGSTDLSVEEFHISECVENLLVVWGSLLASDSTVSLVSVNESILVPFLRESCRSEEAGTSSVNFPTRLTTWFMQGISDMFLLLYKPDDSCYKDFCNGFLLASLSLRPVLSLTSDCTARPQHHPLPEVVLICRVLKFSASAQSNALSEKNRCDLCCTLLNEVTVYASGASKKLNASVNPLISGNLQLMCALSKGYSSVLQVLYDEGIVPFLLETCLGLRKTDDGELWSLCNDKEAKYFAYTMILIIARWRQDIAEEIFEKVRQVHISAIEGLRLSEEPSHSKISKNDAINSSSKEFVKASFKPERDTKSDVGYCGLRNLGCTCYMNSLLQVLYMIPEVRRGVLAFPIYSDRMTEEAQADSLLLQLQKIFMYLSESQRKAYNPKSWALAYKDESGILPINVTQQQDAQEFLQMLCERLESQYCIPQFSMANSLQGMVLDGCIASPAQNVNVKFNVMQQAFGGKLSNQMMRVGNESDIREKEEPFVCISLDVVGTSGLENSLSKFVAGETISDFQWDESTPRETIVKRQCLDELSNTVIFHLKRFELNFDTFMREKVNDAFPFPTFLNLFPYSKEGLAAKRAGQSEHNRSKRSISYYQYELQGIVEHTGTTDSGHYFSYIREAELCIQSSPEESDKNDQNGARRRWIEFNDSEVSLFSESRIPAECFGGMTTIYDVSNKDIVQRSSVNPKNAYMLMYRRVHPIAEESTKTDNVVSKEVIESSSKYKEALRAEINNDNICHVLCSRVFNQPHISFMIGLFDSFKAFGTLCRSTWNKEGTYVAKPTTILEDFVYFSVKIAGRTIESSLYSDLLTRIVDVLCNKQEKIMNSSPTDIGKENIPFSTSKMDTSEDDEAVALSLSLQRTTAYGACAEKIQDVAPTQLKTGFEPEAVRVAAAVDIMNFFLSEFDNMCSLLYHTEPTTRMTTARVFIHVYVILASNNFFTKDVIDSIPLEILKGSVISSTQVAMPADMVLEAGSVTDMAIIENPALPESARCSEAGLMSFLENNTNPAIVSIKFLLELTKDDKIQAIAEHWRRSDGVCWLIHSITKLNWQSRYIFIVRELIVGICDVLLGDQSVTGGGLFVQGTRKRAASSYVHAPHVKPGSSNHHLKNIPDWTLLFDSLALLVTLPVSSDLNVTIRHILGDLSVTSIKSKVLVSTALKQSRYCPAICKIMRFNCFENFNESNVFAEAIGETLSMCSCDAVFHIFGVLSEFLEIPDHMSAARVGLIFSGAHSILDMAKDCQDSRPAFVSVFIKSLLELAAKNIYVYENLSSSTARIEYWAKWMLKFSYQYQGKVRAEADSLATLKSGANSTSNPNSGAVRYGEETKEMNKGPYLPIFGESESSFELPSSERAELCFQTLRSMLLRMGANPDLLIPDEAFIELPPDEASIGAAFDLDSAGVVEVGGETIAPGGDHMTDEEFARFLASQG